MKVLGSHSLLVLAVSLLVALPSKAQDYIYSVGTPAFTTAEPVELGFINVANGNLHIEIPISSPPQRGKLSAAQRLVYDSRIWMIFNNTWQPNNIPGSQGGWRFVTAADGSVSKKTIHAPCDTQEPTFYDRHVSWAWTSPDGTKRTFPIETTNDPLGCQGVDTPAADALASDASGYHMYVTGYTNATVFAPDGTQVFPVWKDSNGNMITKESGNLKDTLGRFPVLRTVNGSQTFYDVLNSQGTRSRITVNTGSIPVSTSFGQPGVAEFPGSSLTVVTSINLPDSTSYLFGYDNHGLLNSITLPTGGVITYQYTNFEDAYHNRNRWVSKRFQGSNEWQYTPAVNSFCAPGTQGCAQKVTKRMPSGDETRYVFTMNNGAWISTAQAFTGAASGIPLQTVARGYDFNNQCPPFTCTGAQHIRAEWEEVTVGTIKRRKELTYDGPSTGNVTGIKEWNFANSFAANPDRQTDIAYVNDAAYLAKDIRNLQKEIIVKDGGGAPVAKTVFRYDLYDEETPLENAGTTAQHDVTFDINYVLRGNLSAVHRWASGDANACVAGATNSPACLLTRNKFDTNGQIRQAKDPKGNATSFSYNDSFFHDALSPVAHTPSPATNAYLTQITSPLIGSATLSYYFGTGQVAFLTDQNGAQSQNHYLDPFSRPTLAFGPNVAGGRNWLLTTHTGATQADTFATLNDATASTGCSSCRKERATLDSLGRPNTTSILSDPQGAVHQVTSYDTSGRVASVSNPHRSTGDSTYGLETFSYDGLNRGTQVTHHDGQVFRTFYGSTVAANGGLSARLCTGASPAHPTLVVDEAGKKRQTWRDGFGRVVEVNEPDEWGAYACDMLRLQPARQADTGDARGADAHL